MSNITPRRLDYANPHDISQLVALLEHYAQDPMGGGEALPASVKENLGHLLKKTPHAFSIVAEVDGKAVGLANCFWGVSTFAARPLVNIHDVVVHASFRGKGIAKTLFSEIEKIAREGNACKITLEVLSGNAPAKKLYASLGYGDYALDPGSGTALFWQKKLD
jgi:ribosomal protein S18 acetylase RimI-like enzyme